MTIYKLIAGYIIKQMQENCWVTSLSFSRLNLFQAFLFNECSWFVTKKKWSKYRPKYFESWYRSRESTLILAAVVWRKSQRESIHWFASKSRPCLRNITDETFEHMLVFSSMSIHALHISMMEFLSKCTNMVAHTCTLLSPNLTPPISHTLSSWCNLTSGGTYSSILQCSSCPNVPIWLPYTSHTCTLQSMEAEIINVRSFLWITIMLSIMSLCGCQVAINARI